MPAGDAPKSIEVDSVVVGYDAPVLDRVSLRVEPGEMVALLGPSGCGKTTLLRAIAGLEPLRAGTIRLDDAVMSGPGVHVAAERRNIGMVFQDWALFPHLSVAANVAYGLDRSARGRNRVADVLEMVGLAGYEERSPHTLSGGQQQRVALARALAPEPAVLLLDEPFSNLDATMRHTIRSEVHRILQDLAVTAIFVTHDQNEAFVLGRRVAVMRSGRIEQWAEPVEIYQRPANPWVARFVGEANLLHGTRRGSRATTPLGELDVEMADEACRVTDGADIVVLMRPEDLELHPVGETSRGVSDNPLEAPGRVTLVEFIGPTSEYEVGLADGQRVRCRLASVPRFAVGDAVWVRGRSGSYLAYPNMGDC